MIRFLRPGNIVMLLILLQGCALPYKGLQKEDSSQHPSALRFKPSFDKKLYRCVVDGRAVFKKFHLSGLLFFKDMHDGSTRVVFQNEMGLTFFDFEWDRTDSFQVRQVIAQLDKPAIIRTLQKDMSLLLMKRLNIRSEEVFVKKQEVYHRFTPDNGFAYYITRNDTLHRIENAGKNKVTTIRVSGKQDAAAMPDEVVFDHHKANFTIRLYKINNVE